MAMIRSPRLQVHLLFPFIHSCHRFVNMTHDDEYEACKYEEQEHG
jgi:hypothetical protein